jgi:hypothetical protein
VERFEWSTSKGRLGATVMSLTPQLRAHFGAPSDRGVLVAHVEPGTPAAKAGIEVGDVIVEVRGRKIDASSDVLSAVDGLGKGDHVKVTALRNGTSRSFEATLGDHALATAWWSPPWLRDWSKPFESHPTFSTPLDGPTWFRDWMKLHEPAKPDADSEMASRWLRKLRELIEPKSSGPTCQRS